MPNVDAKLRVITRLPLAELWRDDGFATVKRGKQLTPEDIRELLRSGPVHFVVADLGTAPRWIPEGECFQFWKSEGKPHLAGKGKAHLDGFAGEYCYFASQWEQGSARAPIVVLEKHH